MRYLLLLVLAGCAFAPPDAEPLYNPNYREWFATVEACSHHRGDFDQIRFFVADMKSEGIAGKHQGDNIWIDRDFVDDARTVRHEILHFLIGDRHHRRAEWKTCAVR